MRCSLLLLASWIAVITASPLWSQTSSEKRDADQQSRIQALIEQLSHPRFAVREKAQSELEQIGEPALKALEKAAGSEDMETAVRAKTLIDKIESRRATAKLLAPTFVDMNLGQVTVRDAFERLAAQSGYRIATEGVSNDILDKKIDVKLGRVTFLEALDRICEQAGLTPAQVQSSPARRRRSNPGFGRPRVQPLPAFPRVNPPAINPAKLKKILDKIKKNRGNPQQLKKQLEELRKQLQKQLQPALPLPIPGGVGGQQFQVRGAVIAPVQVQVFPAIPPPLGEVGGSARGGSAIVVRPGRNASFPTCYAGAVKLQIVSVKREKDSIDLVLRITAEPKLAGVGISGPVAVTKAIDATGKPLETVLLKREKSKDDPRRTARPGRRVVLVPFDTNMLKPQTEVTIRLRSDKQPPKSLKLLEGKLNLSLLSPTKPLAIIDNVLKAAGKKAKGKNGESLELVSIRKIGGNRYEVTARMESKGNPLPGAFFAGNVVIRGNVIINGRVMSPQNGSIPVLVDKKGRRYKFGGVTRSGLRGVNGQWTRELTMIYQGDEATTEPQKLILEGRSPEVVRVPFTFRDVRIPPK